MARPLTHAEVERAFFAGSGLPGAAVSMRAGVVVGDRMVLPEGEPDPIHVEGPTGPSGSGGYILTVDGHPYWLPFSLVARRYLDVGPDGVAESGVRIRRVLPGGGLAQAQVYVSSAASPDWGLMLSADGVQQEVLRFGGHLGLRSQDVSGGGPIRYYAFRDELPGDTGWTAFPLASGITGTAQYRVIGGVTHLRGRLTRTAGNWPTGVFTAVATLPVAAAPAQQAYVTATNRGNSLFSVSIAAAGAITVSGSAATGTTAEVELSSIPPFPTT